MKEMKKKILVPLIGTILYAILTYTFSEGVLYEVNDDRYMSHIVSGIVSGTPDGHTIYMNYVFSFLLSVIYRIFPGFDWYGMSMQIFMWLAFYSILYRVVNKKSILEKIIGCIFLVLIWQIVFVRHIIMFEFTLVSAITGVAAVYWISTMDKLQDGFEKKFECLIFVILIILTFFIRKNVLYMVLPFVVVAFVYRFGVTTIKRWSKLFLIIIGILLSTTIIHKVAYTNEEWTSFLRYNSVRSSVYDYTGVPKFTEHETFYKENDISYEEYLCINRYLVGLDYSMDIEMMLERISEYSKNVVEEDKSLEIKSNFFSFINYLSNPTVLNVVKISIFLNVVGIALLLWKKRIREIIAVLIVLGVVGLEYGYLIMGGRFTYSVLIAVLLLEMAILCAGLYNSIRIDAQGFVKGYMTVATVIIMCIGSVWSCSVWDCIIIDKNAQEKATYKYDKIMQYCRDNPDNFYVSLGGNFASSTKNLNIREEQSGLNYTGIVGWSIYTPLENKKLENHGIQSIERAILNNDNVYVIHGETKSAECVREYLNKRYGCVDWILQDSFSIDSEVYQVYKLKMNCELQ